MVPKANKSLTHIEKIVDKAIKNYENNPSLPTLFAILTALPGTGWLVSAGKEIIDHTIEKMAEERLKTLIDELAQGDIELTSEIVEKEEFIHSVLVVYRSAIRTYEREKIRCFARLLSNAIKREELASDKFHEFIEILESLSARELIILRILEQLEIEFAPTISINAEQDFDFNLAHKLWPMLERKVEEEIGISTEMLTAILVRLARTGLYEPITGMIIGNTGKMGKTTILFKEFIGWLEIEN